MKKTAITIFAALFATAIMAQDIDLPSPRRTGGMPLMEALARRRSSREFDGRALPRQTLSDLLWAAWGYNRPDKRTAPSSRDKQEIELYVAMQDGLYLYDAEDNRLLMVSDEDLRAMTGTQPFVAKAPLNIIYVCRKQMITDKTPDELIAATYANTGFIAQNVYLFCASDISGTAKAAALRLSAATEASLLAALFISSTRFNTSSVIGRRPRCRRCSS